LVCSSGDIAARGNVASTDEEDTKVAGISGIGVNEYMYVGMGWSLQCLFIAFGYSFPL
jgi:hypothetical protein